eukprot:m.66378 g.66378  ORF g.66378 m.66378 type:complete len:341 (+) comp13747_c1_seq1:266-1288(+)
MSAPPPSQPAGLDDASWASIENPGAPAAPAAEASPAAPAAPAAPASPVGPGLFDMLHMETKNVFCNPGFFHDGAKFTFHRMVTENLIIGHQISLGASNRPQGYNFTATYLGPKRVSPGEGYPLLMGDIDTSGSLTAKIVHQFRDNIKASFQAQSQGKFWAGAQAEIEYHGADFGTSLKLVNINPLAESGVIVSNYLQSVTERFALGGEFMYKYGGQAQSADLALGGRYKGGSAEKGDRWTACATVSADARLDASYYQKLSPKCMVGTELEVTLPRQEAVATVGVQYMFKQSVFRGQVNTKGEVTGVLFRAINPAVTFVLTGLIDHFSGKSQLGVGLMVEQ